MRTLHVCRSRQQATDLLAAKLDENYSVNYASMEAYRRDDVHDFRVVVTPLEARQLQGIEFNAVVYHFEPSAEARTFIESRRRG